MKRETPVNEIAVRIAVSQREARETQELMAAPPPPPGGLTEASQERWREIAGATVVTRKGLLMLERVLRWTDQADALRAELDANILRGLKALGVRR